MKTFLALLALIFQGLLTVEATTITIKKSDNSPLGRTVGERTLVPLLSVDVLATEKRFPPGVFLVVQAKALDPIGATPFTQNVYVGDPSKLISRGPFPVSNMGLTVVGPIFLLEGQWREVVLSVLLPDDLTSLEGRNIGLDVTGISVDSHWTELGDPVNFVGIFPIRSPNFKIDTSIQSEELSIIGSDVGLVSMGPISSNITVTVPFNFVARNGGVRVWDLPTVWEFTSPDIKVKSMTAALLNLDSGAESPLVAEANYFSSANEFGSGMTAIFRDRISIPEGTNDWWLQASLEVVGLTSASQMKVCVVNFGEAEGMRSGHYIIPDLTKAAGLISISFDIFGGTFFRNLMVGIEGEDVRMLQRILNLFPETQVVMTGPDSPGNETRLFDRATELAVGKFQAKYDIEEEGFGPQTRAFLNAHLDDWFVLKARINHVWTAPITGTDRLAVYLHGYRAPEKAYAVEVSTDLKAWESFGGVDVDSLGSSILKEYVGSIPKDRYADQAFFRLIER